VTLLIKTTNHGDEPAENIIWYLDVQEPFELKETEEATQTLPELRCGETANTEYYLTVDPDTRSGEYTLDFNITYSGDFDSNRHHLTTKSMTELTIRVMGHPDLVLIDADIPEVDLKSEFDAKFSIKNVGTGPAKNIKVCFENRTDILPERSIYYIDTVAPNETVLIESGFFVDTIVPSQHPLPIAIYYENETHGMQTAQRYSVLVPVSSGNTLFVYLDSQDELTAGVVGEITIGVANRGLARVKHVALAIADGDRFKLIDSDTRYIGDIENDDYDTVDFRILPESSDCSNVTVDVSYDDDYGNTYSMTTEIPIKVYTSKEMKAIAPKSGGYTWGLVQRKTRSYLTIIGIVIGIMAIVGLISIGVGMQVYMDEQIGKMGVNKIIIMPVPPGGALGGPTSASTYFTDRDVRTVEKVRGVDANC
jgi:hypothetical protein